MSTNPVTQAQINLLAACVQHHPTKDRILLSATADLFEDRNLATLYEAIRKASERSKSFDLVLLAYECNALGATSPEATEELLTRLSSMSLSQIDFDCASDLQVLQDNHLRKQIALKINSLTTLTKELNSYQFHEVEKVLSDVSEFVSKADATSQSNDFVLQDSLSSVIQKIDDLYHNPSSELCSGIPTGIADLDMKTNGLEPGNLVIVAGRPSMGKSSFATSVGRMVAVEQSLPVLIFTLEMPHDQVTTRILSDASGIDGNRLKTGRLADSDWSLLTGGVMQLQSAPIDICQNSSLNIYQLKKKAHEYESIRGALGLVIVDYIQLIEPADKSINREQHISECTRQLKKLAQELRCPVVALSQLNRSIEQRPNKRPVMSDLRESGAIEQDADLIIFIYRDEVYNPDSPDIGTAEVIIGKQRGGSLGTVRTRFEGQFSRFSAFTGMTCSSRQTFSDSKVDYKSKSHID